MHDIHTDCFVICDAFSLSHCVLNVTMLEFMRGMIRQTNLFKPRFDIFTSKIYSISPIEFVLMSI